MLIWMQVLRRRLPPTSSSSLSTQWTWHHNKLCFPILNVLQNSNITTRHKIWFWTTIFNERYYKKFPFIAPAQFAINTWCQGVGLETYNEDFMEGWLSSIPVSVKAGWRWGLFFPLGGQMIITEIQMTKQRSCSWVTNKEVWGLSHLNTFLKKCMVCMLHSEWGAMWPCAMCITRWSASLQPN